MSEPIFNVGLVCKDHAPKPGKFKDNKPADFVGKIVKLGFPATNPLSQKETLEHMWVRVDSLVQPGTYDSGEELVGTLDNDPILDCEYACGDEVAFKVEEIEDAVDA